ERRVRLQGRKLVPFFRASGGVHEHESAAQMANGGEHLRIPVTAAHVIHDLSPTGDGAACNLGLVGIDGENGFGTRPQYACDHRQDALQFRTRNDRLLFAGPGRLTADVQDVSAFVEQMQCMIDCLLVRVELAAVREGIGRDIHDAHDERTHAQGKRAGTQFPVETWSHTGIVARTCRITIPNLMDAHFQLISDGDLARTIELMREFYTATEMHFDEEVARTSLRKTLLDPGLGSVYLVMVEKTV